MKRLGVEERPRLIAFLREDVATNLYLLGVIHRSECSDGDAVLGAFYGTFSNSNLVSVVFVTTGGLLVPYAPNPEDARHLGKKLRHSVQPRMLVGPRVACDELWQGLNPGFTPRLCRDHCLYTLVPGRLDSSNDARVRTARPRDLNRAYQSAADMQTEELGIDPRKVDPRRFRQRVARLIHEDVFYVLEDGDVFVFQASASTYCPDGTQVEAVYTPQSLRGRGWAYKGLSGMCRRLFGRYPLITLHVHETNVAAVKLYTRMGFESHAPFRLISC